MEQVREGPPYGIIARQIVARRVVPFLGAGASSAGAVAGRSLPTGSNFAKTLAEASGYPGPGTDPLTMVAEYAEGEQSGRDSILDLISATFFRKVAADYESSFTQFLSRLPPSAVPQTIISTNYDVLVEQELERLKIPYVAIAHLLRGESKGQFVRYTSLAAQPDIVNLRALNEYLDELTHEPSERPDVGRVLLYKIHGSSRTIPLPPDDPTDVDSIVVTETDYLEFIAGGFLDNVPTQIVDALKSSYMLFLGYSLQDWNFRVLLTKLQQFKNRKKIHWACLMDPDIVQKAFWRKRDVAIFDERLEYFLDRLSGEIEREIAG